MLTLDPVSREHRRRDGAARRHFDVRRAARPSPFSVATAPARPRCCARSWASSRSKARRVLLGDGPRRRAAARAAAARHRLCAGGPACCSRFPSRKTCASRRGSASGLRRGQTAPRRGLDIVPELAVLRRARRGALGRPGQDGRARAGDHGRHRMVLLDEPFQGLAPALASHTPASCGASHARARHHPADHDPTRCWSRPFRRHPGDGAGRGVRDDPRSLPDSGQRVSATPSASRLWRAREG